MPQKLLVVADMGKGREAVGLAHRTGENRKAIAGVISSAAGFERCLDGS